MTAADTQRDLRICPLQLKSTGARIAGDNARPEAEMHRIGADDPRPESEQLRMDHNADMQLVGEVPPNSVNPPKVATVSPI
jgi:hypothetical protein